MATSAMFFSLTLMEELYLLSDCGVGLHWDSRAWKLLSPGSRVGRKNRNRGRVSHVRPLCSAGKDASVREPEQRVEKSQRDTSVCCVTQGTYDTDICHEHLINIVFDHSCLLRKVRQGGFTSSKEMTSIRPLATEIEIYLVIVMAELFVLIYMEYTVLQGIKTDMGLFFFFFNYGHFWPMD